MTVAGWQPPRPLLLVALFGALLVHGALGLYGSYANTYDAYIHMFFADHWVRGWFDPWEPRWYTGFTMTSYPPLSHQSVAILSYFTGDLRTAFVLVQSSTMVGLTLGMYRFARLWVTEEAAQWAAIWVVCSSALAETVHVFGQLPTIFSLALLLNALPSLYRWADEGRYYDLLCSWALVAATTGAHHVTTLFGAVFIIAPVIMLALLQHFHTPLADEPPVQPRYWTRANWRALSLRRLRRLLGPLLRTALFGVVAILLLLVIVWPYWVWSRLDPISQVPIPHASRDNYLVNLNAGLIFWLVPYGMLLPIMPYLFVRGFFSRAWPLTASITLLALLGTGGTTPIPRLLLRGAFDILTLDRFTLWAAVLMLPLAGHFVVSLKQGSLARLLQIHFGRVTWHSLQLGYALGIITVFVLTVSLPQFRRFQPAPIDMQPILNFIDKDQHGRWRFLTLGFGDQMAWLSIRTSASQVDGNYHAARRLPEMTTTAVERLEGAKFRGIPGIGSLQQFLNVPEKFNLKYIFANDNFYDPLLFFYGWHRLEQLENNIVVWEREDIVALPEVLPRREIPLYQRIMFGTLPPLALLAALAITLGPYGKAPLRLMVEVLGWQDWSMQTPPLLVGLRQRWQRIGKRIWRQLDQRLLAASQLPVVAEAPEPPWQFWMRMAQQRAEAIFVAVSPVTQRRNILLLLITFVLTFYGVLLWQHYRRNQSAAVIAAYYDDLDFKRFQAAYFRLNPAKRPTFAQYMLELSVEGGLLPSYSKLDSLTLTTLSWESDYQQVAVTARYITALAYYTATNTLTLERAPAGQWFIDPAPTDPATPPEQFLRRAEVNWLAQGRRRVTGNTTNFADVLDRPELAVLSARLVVCPPGHFSLVGELLNRDVDPADVTVSGLIYDDQGRLLTWYNAGDMIMHKLFPLEITPFRIDFEGVAGAALADVATDLSFTPGARWDYALPISQTISAFEVTAKAVVTQHDLLRQVGVQELRVQQDDTGQWWLSGVMINNDLRVATVPHLLITFYDEAGQVRWVDQHYLPLAIRPQYAQPFRVPLTPATDIHGVDVPGKIYTNSLNDAVTLHTPRLDFVTLPPTLGYHYLRVSVNYFVEE
ncbi:MAG: hypothetical protein R3C14_27705 [Caldilineaceae bacterium]